MVDSSVTRSGTLRVMLDETALGNMFAFGCLYDELGTETYTLCLRMVETRGQADQTALETWLRVWQYAASLTRVPPRARETTLLLPATLVGGSSRMRKSMTVGLGHVLRSVERSPKCLL